ncbi:MAG: DUF3127 domain-containing protein [Pseudomonadota bacterium]|nr:DUF3127 domain-containing protein [Pseudomonadota bacterium]
MGKGYQAEGTLRAILDTDQVSDSFRKREFALEIEDGKFPQTVKFQAVQDRTEMLDAFSVGQQVRVHFDLRGREYTRKRDGVTDWWVNLDCWRMEPLEEGAAPSAPEVSHSDTVSGGEFDDEIPF